VERFVKLFDNVAFFALSSMVFIVVASVLGRLLFDITGGELNLVLPGSVELSSYALLIMVFASLPRAAISGLVSVDILLGLLPKRIRRGLERLWDLLLAVFATIIGALFYEKVFDMFERGDKSQDLGIPLYLVYGVLTLCSACIALTSLWLAFRSQRPETFDSNL